MGELFEMLGDEWKGHPYQKVSLVVARYFDDKPDDFIVPRVEESVRPDNSLALFCEGNLLAANFDRELRLHQLKVMKGRNDDQKKREQYLDTTEIEKEHGVESKDSPAK